MKSINLIFGCHSHQPVGNFDFVFAQAYDKAYVPFIDVLERFPAVRVKKFDEFVLGGGNVGQCEVPRDRS